MTSSQIYTRYGVELPRSDGLPHAFGQAEKSVTEVSTMIWMPSRKTTGTAVCETDVPDLQSRNRNRISHTDVLRHEFDFHQSVSACSPWLSRVGRSLCSLSIVLLLQVQSGFGQSSIA